MSKYEKQAWAIGIYALLGAVLLCVFHQSFVNDPIFRVFSFSGYGFGFIITAGLWRHNWIDFTETETRIAHKATAWTFYGTIIIAGALITLLLPKEISRDVTGMALIYTVLIFLGVRFILLACLLRQKRTKSTHSNS